MQVGDREIYREWIRKNGRPSDGEETNWKIKYSFTQLTGNLARYWNCWNVDQQEVALKYYMLREIEISGVFDYNWVKTLERSESECDKMLARVNKDTGNSKKIMDTWSSH